MLFLCLWTKDIIFTTEYIGHLKYNVYENCSMM